MQLSYLQLLFPCVKLLLSSDIKNTSWFIKLAGSVTPGGIFFIHLHLSEKQILVIWIVNIIIKTLSIPGSFFWKSIRFSVIQSYYSYIFSFLISNIICPYACLSFFAALTQIAAVFPVPVGPCSRFCVPFSTARAASLVPAAIWCQFLPFALVCESHVAVVWDCGQSLFHPLSPPN